MYLNKNNASSSASSPDKEKKNVDNFKISFTDDYPRKNAEILSGQYGINLLLVGLSLMLALSYSGSAVKEECLLSLLITLMLLQIIWMMWYIIRKDRQTCFVSEKDSDAGTSWLRGGLSLLALISIIMDGFQIGYYVGYKACLSPAVGVYPVIHAVHTISQVHFLWFHVKDVIKTFATFARFGVIHAVFTNLLLWCNGVISEAKHFFDTHKRLLDLGNTNITGGSLLFCVFVILLFFLQIFIIDFLSKRLSITNSIQFVMNKNIHIFLCIFSFSGEEEPHCNCTTNTCSILSNGLSYLYPFNIEYHIFVSVVLFVMWKNIGLTTEYQTNQNIAMRTNGLVAGPILGVVALASTIVVLVLYVIKVGDSVETRESAVTMFYCYGIVMLLFMGTNERDLVETIPEIYYVSAGSSLSLAPPYNGIVSRAFENQDKVSLENDQVDNNQGYSHTRSLPEGSSSLPTRSSEKLSNRRRVLKNIAVFLFLCNISLWILPAFGCRPQFDNGIEEETFGYTIWTTIVTVAMPLNLFYRMHSVVSLTDVFRNV
ncbi:OTOP1 protein, partial [Polyodon spathula]|nr:OTOP1 protein [Polyodon spathula]